ncbi:VOC family protein [Flavobacterium sp.]|uniref:VOC family protein n=1 Tax=Flavobacterium sp. TaxID=239 RepID=UPI0034537CC6
MMEDKKNENGRANLSPDDTPKVTGVGGIFFYSDNPKEIKEWYAKNLGLEISAWGTSNFESRNLDRPEEINSLQWCSFKTADGHFLPSKKEFMVNYRVQHIEALVENLRKNGVNILDEITTYEYGKFVHIMDAEGNKVELWEDTAPDIREIGN